MGKERTTNDTYAKVYYAAATEGTKAFDYSAHVESHGGTVADLLDPRNPKIRESAFPGSTFLGVIGDATGSMKEAPVKWRSKMPQLVSLLTQGGYTQQPAIWFGVVGDANVDQWPFQFMLNVESDLAIIDPIVTSMILEGGGGGGRASNGLPCESYATAAWFCDNRFDIDEWKRGEKGTLVFIGDEGCYPYVTAREIREQFNLPVQENYRTEDIFESLTQKFDVYLIRPGDGSYAKGSELGNAIEAQWKSLIGLQNVLHIEDTADVMPMIAGLVGYRNGISLDKIAADIGNDSVTMALAPLGSAITPSTPKKSSVRRFSNR